MNKRLYGAGAAIVAVIAAVTLYAANPTRASDHQDSPSALARPGADITDPYIFPSPTNPANVVVVLEGHPLIPSGQGLTTYFDPGVVYQMNFDTTSENGGAFPSASVTRNQVIQFVFGTPGSSQPVTVYGPAAAPTTTTSTSLVTQTGTGTINTAFNAGGMQIFAGAREDAFFFDLAQFLKILPDRNAGSTAPSCLPTPLGGNNTCPTGWNNPGSDTLKGFNVLSIVVEMPRALLRGSGGPKIAYWASTHTSTGN